MSLILAAILLVILAAAAVQRIAGVGFALIVSPALVPAHAARTVAVAVAIAGSLATTVKGLLMWLG